MFAALPPTLQASESDGGLGTKITFEQVIVMPTTLQADESNGGLGTKITFERVTVLSPAGDRVVGRRQTGARAEILGDPHRRICQQPDETFEAFEKRVEEEAKACIRRAGDLLNSARERAQVLKADIQLSSA